MGDSRPAARPGDPAAADGEPAGAGACGAPARPHLARGVACALAGGVFWGFSANCAEVLMGTWAVPVEWITCARLVCAAAFFLALAVAREGRRVLAVLADGPSLARIAGFAILGILLTQVSYLSAIGLAGAGTALLLEQLGLVLVMLFACLQARRSPRPRELAGLACALAGVVLIATQGDLGTLAVPLAGLVWGLVSAVSLAFYNLMPVRPLARYGSFLVTGVAMALAGAVALVDFRPWEQPVVLPPEGWAVFAAIVGVGTILAYLLFVQGIKDAGPVRAGLLGSVEPVSALVISAVWLGTPVSPWDVAGAAAIVAMIFLVSQREGAPAPARDAAPSGSPAPVGGDAAPILSAPSATAPAPPAPTPAAALGDDADLACD